MTPIETLVLVMVALAGFTATAFTLFLMFLIWHFANAIGLIPKFRRSKPSDLAKEAEPEEEDEDGMLSEAEQDAIMARSEALRDAAYGIGEEEPDYGVAGEPNLDRVAPEEGTQAYAGLDKGDFSIDGDALTFEDQNELEERV